MLEQVFTKRLQPYVPVKSGDPYPLDWTYELPTNLYCNVHGSHLQSTNNDSTDSTSGTEDTGTTTGLDDSGNNNNMTNSPNDFVNNVPENQ
jgi:penicillin-binding protein 1A